MTRVVFADNMLKNLKKQALFFKLCNFAVNGTRVFLLPCKRRYLRSICGHWFSRCVCPFCRLKKEKLKQLVSFTFHVERFVCAACMDLNLHKS